jgi:hypothetical protein
MSLAYGNATVGRRGDEVVTKRCERRKMGECRNGGREEERREEWRKVRE